LEGRVEDDEGPCSLHVERLEVLTGGEKERRPTPGIE